MAEVNLLTWTQVEELYLKPQRADVTAVESGSAGVGISGGSRIDERGNETHGPQDLPSFEQFRAICRANGMREDDDALRRIYDVGKKAGGA